MKLIYAEHYLFKYYTKFQTMTQQFSWLSHCPAVAMSLLTLLISTLFSHSPASKGLWENCYAAQLLSHSNIVCQTLS